MRRRHDAQDVVRGGPGPDDPQPQVVVAQGLGHEDCPPSWDEARDRRCGATAGGAAKSGWSATSSRIRASNLTVPTMPTLRPKLRSVPRRSFSMSSAFAKWLCALLK